MADDKPVIYVSPDGQSEMPLSSPAARLNWEARGWRPKNDKTPRQPAARRAAADE
jgi:hypothetical protein